jgi:hypothetical protein
MRKKTKITQPSILSRLRLSFWGRVMTKLFAPLKGSVSLMVFLEIFNMAP